MMQQLLDIINENLLILVKKITILACHTINFIKYFSNKAIDQILPFHLSIKISRYFHCLAMKQQIPCLVAITKDLMKSLLFCNYLFLIFRYMQQSQLYYQTNLNFYLFSYDRFFLSLFVKFIGLFFKHILENFNMLSYSHQRGGNVPFN